MSLELALSSLAQFVPQQDVLVWSNGASFDIPILNSAFNDVNVAAPWKFYNERCYRTMKNLYPDVPYARAEGSVAHNALHDARDQARHLQLIWAAHNKK
jgi:hypothetical protein